MRTHEHPMNNPWYWLPAPHPARAIVPAPVIMAGGSPSHCFSCGVYFRKARNRLLRKQAHHTCHVLSAQPLLDRALEHAVGG